MIAVDTNVLVYAHRPESPKHHFDAQIVALCREHGVSRLLTVDRDFNRFTGLRTERLDI